MRLKKRWTRSCEYFSSFEVLPFPVLLKLRRLTLPSQFSSIRSRSRIVEIPICYDAEFALDLDRVAERTKLSAGEVVDLHSTAEYRVACIGFVPGFPFLTGLASKLATPRRDTPRKEIPSGSVGIGGAQTGIYPLRSPGGWNLIGRTPLKLFDPTKDPPSLLQAGDRVRFRAIAREEFAAFAEATAAKEPLKL